LTAKFADGFHKNPHWTGKVELVEKHLLDPLRWKPAPTDEGIGGCGEHPVQKYGSRPRRIFVDSMGDLFHENVTDEMRDRIFAIMALCPQHIFQVLTKRPERMLEYFANDIRGMRWLDAWDKLPNLPKLARASVPQVIDGVLPNIWVGVSVENQVTADERIPLLLQTPAAMRFVSCEPLLGAVDLRCVQFQNEWEVNALTGDHGVYRPLRGRSDRKLDWVIAGGESGPGARPIHPEWARGLRDQCQDAGVPFFFKSWGEWGRLEDHRGLSWKVGDERTGYFSQDAPGDYEWHSVGVASDGQHMLRVGKKAAGRLLDGRAWEQFPEARG
jgi:protein gp37